MAGRRLNDWLAGYPSGSTGSVSTTSVASSTGRSWPAGVNAAWLAAPNRPAIVAHLLERRCHG